MILMLCLSLLGTPSDAEADYVLFNARIHVVNPPGARAEALAVLADRFVAVGSNRDLLQQFPDARRIDVRGLTIVPGFIDAHAHLDNLARSLNQAQLAGTRSVEEVLARLEVFASKLPEDVWLTGRGWDQNDWPSPRFPHREDLDHTFPDRPVWLRRIDGHAGWANTAALRAAGVIPGTRAPAGGYIEISPEGDPTGILLDAAMALVDDAVPAVDESRLEHALVSAVEMLHAAGITCVHDAGSDLATIRRFKRLIEDQRIDVRIYAMTAGTGDAFEYFCSDGAGAPFQDRLTVRSVKFYLDGALGSRGAALLEEYADDPGNVGLLQHEPEALSERVRRAVDCGFQVAIHAIGDRANRMALDIYQEVLTPEQRSAGRHRVEHAQVVHPSDFPRFAQLGIIASVQPTHATSDMPWAEERLGPERMNGAYAWRSLIASGARLALGSDFPVEEVSPLLGFYAAISRRDSAGSPPGGWYPEQALTRDEALRGFTLDAAYAGFLEGELGSIEPGKLADFTILESDLMELPVEDVSGIQVVATYVGGRRVFGSW